MTICIIFIDVIQIESTCFETPKADTEALAVEVVLRLSGDLVGSELFFEQRSQLLYVAEVVEDADDTCSPD